MTRRLAKSCGTAPPLEPFNVIATLIFFLAIIHTFLAKRFMRIAHRWREEHEAKDRGRRGGASRATGSRRR